MTATIDIKQITRGVLGGLGVGGELGGRGLGPDELGRIVRRGELDEPERRLLGGYVRVVGLLEPGSARRAEDYLGALHLPGEFGPDSARTLGAWARDHGRGVSAVEAVERTPPELADALLSLVSGHSTATEEGPKRLEGLESAAYEHSTDRAALATLRAIPGIAAILGRVLDATKARCEEVQHLANSIRVSERSLPTLHACFQRACETLDVDPMPRLYVHLSGNSAYTVGADEPIVVLSSILADRFNASELTCLLGHELGHIKSGHYRYHALARAIQAGTKHLAQLTLGLAETAGNAAFGATLYAWCRRSELTADRAGYLACQDREVALRTMMKVAGVPGRHAHEIDTRAYIEQAREYEEHLRRSHLQRFYVLEDQLSQTHPYMGARVLELLDWIEEGGAAELIEADPAGLRAIARRAGDDPGLNELASSCARVLTAWAARTFSLTRSEAGPIVRRMIFARNSPDGTRLAPILRVALHIAKEGPDDISYVLDVIVNKGGEAIGVSLPIPFEAGWHCVPTSLRNEFIYSSQRELVRLLYTPES